MKKTSKQVYTRLDSLRRERARCLKSIRNEPARLRPFFEKRLEEIKAEEKEIIESNPRTAVMIGISVIRSFKKVKYETKDWVPRRCRGKTLRVLFKALDHWEVGENAGL